MTIVVRSRHQPVERVLHQPLAFRVERGGRFVEQQQRRVAQQRAGDGDALALAARQPRAAFAHEGVEPVGKRAQEFLGIGVARGLPQLVLARVPIAVAQIVARATRRRSPFPAAPSRCAGGCRRDRRRAGRRRRAARAPPADRRSARRAGRWSSCRRPTGRPPPAVSRGLTAEAEIVRAPMSSRPRRIMEGDVLERRARRAPARAAAPAWPARGFPARRRAIRPCAPTAPAARSRSP